MSKYSEEFQNAIDGASYDWYTKPEVVRALFPHVRTFNDIVTLCVNSRSYGYLTAEMENEWDRLSFKEISQGNVETLCSDWQFSPKSQSAREKQLRKVTAVIIPQRHLTESEIHSLPTVCSYLGYYSGEIKLLQEGEPLYGRTHLQVMRSLIKRVKPCEPVKIMHRYCKRYGSPWYDRYEGRGPMNYCCFYVGQPPVEAYDARDGSGNSFCSTWYANVVLDNEKGFSLVASGLPDNYAKKVESWEYFICATDEQLSLIFPSKDVSLGSTNERMLGRDYDRLMREQDQD